MVDIPVLDVAPIMAENHRDALIDDLRTAYGEIGFAYITGHGVDRALIDAVFDANRAFHALPFEEKLALKVDCLLYTSPSPRDQRGSRMPSSA